MSSHGEKDELHDHENGPPPARVEESRHSPTSPPPQTATAPPVRSYHPFSVQVIALLIPGAIFGLLARLGLDALATYDGQSVFPLAWVQGMGCFIMGLAVGLREPISAYYPPLFTAITTGFCGSLTTFSSWQLDMFLAWSNGGGFHRIWIYDIMDGLTKTLLTLMVSLSSLSFGVHIASHILPYTPALTKIVPPSRLTQHIVTTLSIIAYALTIVFYFRLSHRFRHEATAALLFAFPGALTRHTFSINLNPIYPPLPLGTLSANAFGTALLAIFHVLQRLSGSGAPSATACALLQGLMDGYCGCLTTISSFAVEVRGLKGRRGWVYVGVSWTIGQLIMVVVVGSAWWSGRIKESQRCAYT